MDAVVLGLWVLAFVSAVSLVLAIWGAFAWMVLDDLWRRQHRKPEADDKQRGRWDRS